ncbi:Protein of unknown function [Bacillus cereus]|nr:Protein of unknown function [Bacillus cereus]
MQISAAKALVFKAGKETVK